MTTPEASSVEAGARGATHVADRVVAKIAMQAAREALRASGPTAGPMRANARAKVSVSRQGKNDLGQAHVQVSVDLDYPTRIGSQCAEVRRRVRERVENLAGMSVRQVAVSVEGLHGPQSSDGERVR
ncbi:Asp23/Gls24 family envelope stress response protein [Streptomyces sp. B8F3]|uniref:Asp23/Gls24 family envelope stress response protein n=1 Tax=Streptomyces sp. B8F3 TaxID=3153573 RepID=UPI00325D5C14